MKIFFSEVFATADVKIIELLKIIGEILVCVIAIKTCGVIAVGIIGFLALIKIAAEM